MINNFIVYILKCNDGSYYVGHTENIEQRISGHKAKTYGGYTATRLPVEVVFVELFETRELAFEVERKIKKWTRKKKEALIKGDFDKIKLLAKKKF